VFERGQNIVENRRGGRSAPTTVNSSVRTREYLTTAEIERLMAAARKSSRYGHRDATMILIGYRHGLRASELCDLQWSQVELATGRLHVRRAKNGSPSVHPMTAQSCSDAGRSADGSSPRHAPFKWRECDLVHNSSLRML
jgi:integrase